MKLQNSEDNEKSEKHAENITNEQILKHICKGRRLGMVNNDVEGEHTQLTFQHQDSLYKATKIKMAVLVKE